MGIDKKGFEFLFDKFARGEKAREIKKSGVGLGLYLGKKIVEAHKGKIIATSEGREKGSVFIIELPMEKKR
jgi:signal transduction histidine kinase